MDSQDSTLREYNDEIDQLCQCFANAFLSPTREETSRAKDLPIKSPPRPVGLQDYNSSKQVVKVGADPFSVTSCAQRTEASQSRSLQTHSTLPTTDPQSYTAGREAINLSPDPLRKSSSTQSTAARQSLVIRPPLPHGMLGLQNGASNKSHDENNSGQSQRPSRAGGAEARPRNIPPIPARAGFLSPQNAFSTSLAGDLGSTPFMIPSNAHRKTARQSRGVPVPYRRRRRPRNHLDVLRPNPYRTPSRAQREAVFKAAERLRALDPRNKTSFYELPVELRLMIYKYALTSQSPITPRLDQAQKAESKEAPAGATECSTLAKASSLTLLQTCRLVDMEARSVYYASNTFRFTSAKDLVHFLHHLEPDLLNELQKLHIEGLLTYKPAFTEQSLAWFLRAGILDVAYQNLAPSMRVATLSDHAMAAAFMLRKCRRLRCIHLTMGPKDELRYVSWLRRMTGRSKTIIDFVHDDYWVLRSASPASTREWFTVLLTALTDRASYRALFPVVKEGERRCIDVNFGIDRVMKEMGSGIRPRARR